MKLRHRDRYVNNRILECLSRPQYAFSCGLTSLTCVVNYLYGDKLGIVTQEELGGQLGFKASESGYGEGPGNEDLFHWFKTILKRNNLKGSSSISLTYARMPKVGTAAFERMATELKQTIRSPRSILVYHSANHYSPICGYFEEAQKPAEPFAEDPEVNRWLLVADHNPEADPIQCVRLREVRKEFKKERIYGILLFSNAAR